MRNVLVGLVASVALASATQAAVTLDMQTGKSAGTLYLDTLMSINAGALEPLSNNYFNASDGTVLVTKAAANYYFANNIWNNSSNGTDGLPNDGQITSSTYGTLNFTYGASQGNSPASAVGNYSVIAFDLAAGQQAQYEKLLLAVWRPYGDKSANITVTYDDATTTVFSGFQFSAANASETLLSGLDRWNGKLDTATQNNGESYQNYANQSLYLYTLDLNNSKFVKSFSMEAGGELVIYDTFGVAVPEPTSMAVIALGGLGLLRRRRA